MNLKNEERVINEISHWGGRKIYMIKSAIEIISFKME